MSCAQGGAATPQGFAGFIRGVTQPQRGPTMDYIQVLHGSIDRAVERFQRNPFDFLFEADLQGLLFGFLLDDCKDETIEIAGGYHPADPYTEPGSRIRTVSVKCEYPNSHKFDIAILDSQAVEHFDRARCQEHNWKNDFFWRQPVRAAVEVKYYQLGDSRSDRVAEVAQDVEKLRRYHEDHKDRAFLGISLLFVQSGKLISAPFRDGSPIADDPSEGIAKYVVTPTGVDRFAV